MQQQGNKGTEEEIIGDLLVTKGEEEEEEEDKLPSRSSNNAQHSPLSFLFTYVFIFTYSLCKVKTHLYIYISIGIQQHFRCCAQPCLYIYILYTLNQPEDSPAIGLSTQLHTYIYTYISIYILKQNPFTSSYIYRNIGIGSHGSFVKQTHLAIYIYIYLYKYI